VGTGILNLVLLPLPPRPARLAGLALLASLAVAAVAVSPASASADEQPAANQSANEQSTAGAAPRWAWPIAGARIVLRPFVAPETSYGAGHRGIDLATAVGTIVFAPADGVIHFSGTVVDRPVLSIEHDGSLLSSFEPVASALPAGTAVHRGDPVGTIATSSRHCTSSCLHFGVRLHGQYLSPLNYLGGIPYPVLLPTRALN
jgi:murein DD-endopeptidase MepM/ murein hydrolase activator NlpD